MTDTEAWPEPPEPEQERPKELFPADWITTDSLPLVALDPDQSPLAEQLEALDELQASAKLELIGTELEFDDKDTVGAGVGAGPESDPDPPPPPPQETEQTSKKTKINFFI